MEVFDVNRVLANLQKLEKQTADLSQAMSAIESSIATAPTLTGLTANASALPTSGDFSNTPYTPSVGSVDYKGDVSGPDSSNTFVVNAVAAEANTITSYGFPVGNTANEYHITLVIPSGADTPITFWMSTKPGSNSIVQNAYVTDRAQAAKLTSNTTIKFRIGDSTGVIANSTHIYTHSYLLEDKTYYMNFTYDTFGNFSGKKMAVDFEVPSGIFNTSLTLTGLKQ